MKTKLNGIEVNYEIHGKEGAPWVTFSHSLACSLRMWDAQVAAFQDRFRILLYLTEGMVIAPCSMKTLAAVAHAHADDLIARAADVVLKERRRLVLVPRETPLNLAHLRNMAAVTEMGGIIFPPVPAFYAKPKSLEDLVAHSVARILDLFGVHSARLARWQGMKGTPPERD